METNESLTPWIYIAKEEKHIDCSVNSLTNYLQSLQRIIDNVDEDSEEIVRERLEVALVSAPSAFESLESTIRNSKKRFISYFE